MSTTYPIETGTSNKAVRKEVIDNMIKQVAARAFKFKQAVAVVSSSADKGTFWREDLSISSGPTGNAFKGIPRNAAFPHSETNWQEVSVRMVKFGTEMNIPWEDIISGKLSVLARNLIRRTEEVVKAVDDYIWDELTGTLQTGSDLQFNSFAITSGYSWNFSSAAIIDDLMRASQLISTNGNYDVGNLLCFVSPRDHRSIKKWVYDKGAQWQNLAQGVAVNGTIGNLAGITIVESASVTSSYALVVKPKTCATYLQNVPLQSEQQTDAFKSLRIRVVERGAIEITDPKAIVLISNTQGAGA